MTKMMILSDQEGNQIFASHLKAPLGELGFTIEEGMIRRDKKAGYEYISYQLMDRYKDERFHLEYSAVKRIEPIQAICDEYLIDLIPEEIRREHKSWTLAFNAERIRDYKFNPASKHRWMAFKDIYKSDATEEGIIQLINEFLEIIKLYIIPTFDKYNDIRVLDAFINEKPEYYFDVIHLLTGNGLVYKKMIIAKLAGNKEYELVCEAMKQFIMNAEGKQTRLPVEAYYAFYERIYERLKTVEPLADPVLG